MSTRSPADREAFRRASARYPTAVTVVTTMDGEDPVGMAVGSFTSISSDSRWSWAPATKSSAGGSRPVAATSSPAWPGHRVLTEPRAGRRDRLGEGLTGVHTIGDHHLVVGSAVGLRTGAQDDEPLVSHRGHCTTSTA
ncbi:flavin reductase family protein [Streptomyces mutabilis]|uniref:flavin reductase family protein n=1 Tax=Streptomyces mutabilis TaxID=67332 RepID=UPI00364B5226